MNARNDQGHPRRKTQRGAVLIFVAVSLAALLGIGALAIDVGYGVTTRNELQNVADAGALAGARYLGEEYSKLAPSEMASHTFTQAEVYNAVNAVASQNQAANLGITIRSEDVGIGRWDATQSVKEIDQTYPTYPMGPDAVTVIARRDGSANGPISTFLARIFNINTMNVTSETAIAALSGPDQVGEGELQTPFALSENVFPNDCKDTIAFSPTKDSCAGWHNFFDAANASALGDKMLGLIEGHTEENCDHCGDPLLEDYLLSGPDWLDENFTIKKGPEPEETPVTSTQDEINFIGGSLSTLFNGTYLVDYDGNTGTLAGSGQPAPMFALFDFFRYRDGDGNNAIWTATIPVYKDSGDSCTNPNKSIEVVGFAKIEVLAPNPPPDSTISVKVDCDLVITDGRGSGTTYGNLRGTIPNLVK